MRIYTSGWPKNQNRCWNRTGSPPPEGSKKAVFRFRSVRSMVIAPARTGSERSRRIVVIFTDQTNNGVADNETPERSFLTVVIKLIEARIDLAPARWREKITMSTDGPE